MVSPSLSRLTRPLLAILFLAGLHGPCTAELLAYWNFDDSESPAIATDVVNSRQGQLQGGASYTADRGGHTGESGDFGMDFGTNDGGQTVLVADASFLNPAAADDEVTFSFWQKLRAVSNSSTFWAVSPSSEGNQRGMQVHLPWSNGTIYFDSAGCCGDSQRATANPPAPFDWTAWHHFAVLKNGGTKQVWIDGVLALDASGAAPLPADLEALYLGSELGNNSLQGVLDDFAIFEGSLSPADIELLASGTSPLQLGENPDLSSLLVSPATNVSTTSATLTGSVTGIGAGAPSVTIYYGNEDGARDPAGWDESVALPGTQADAFSTTVDGLIPGETYFFSARASNPAGDSWSADSESFTTTPLAPTVQNLPARNVQAFTATIGAEVQTTGGEEPSVTIYHGTSDGGTSSGEWDAKVELGVHAGSVTTVLNELAPGTAYFYRAFASNSGGSSWAPVTTTFSTVAAMSATVQNAPADQITGSSARLRGRVTDIGNDPPTVTIFYGTTDGGNSPEGWEFAVSEGTRDDSFSRTVSLLTPETTYYFRARAVNAFGTSWAPTTASFSTTTPTPLTVVINEIHHDADPKTEPAEFVELLNAGDLPADLSNWRLAGGVDYQFPAGTTLEAGNYLVVAEDPATLQTKFGVSTTHQYEKGLDNDGEEIRLLDGDNNEIDRVNYRAGFPWPTAARGTGSSMELFHPALDNNLGGSWRSSSSGPVGPVATYVSRGAAWRYRKGTSEASNPVDAWRTIDFAEDASWLDGTAVIGYGDGDDDTLITDMQGNYSSIYLRKEFVVPAGEIPGELLVRCYIDDGAIVWINGKEVARFSVTSGAKSFDSIATSHERAWEEELISNAGNVLVGGTNVVAVHALNASRNSSDFSFDLELKTPEPGSSTGAPTPGARNTVWLNDPGTAPPLIRQVDHTPGQPAANEDVLITAKVTDRDGVASVTLAYQLVGAGRYVRLTDSAYESNWSEVPMLDDGTGGDLLAGDAIYSVTLPASIQTHRRLVRYRIRTEDERGRSLQVPYPDDESPNFAYFVYNGVPAWTGAERPGVTATREFPASVMNDSLPVYHLIADPADVTNSQYNNGSDGVRMRGTLVYEGKVYDHIQFYNRGEASTYVSGKNKWRFKFNRARDFEARDIYGRRYKTRWKTMNFNACASPWVDVNRGMAGIDEAVPHRLYQLAGVPSSHTHWVQFRVVDSTREAPSDQYAGDLWGLYLAIEHPDGRFLAEHDLPEGNVYKIQNGAGDKKNQGPTQPVNSSDWSSFYSASNNLNSVRWWRENFNLHGFYGFRAINRATGNVDLRDHTNYYMYHHPDGRWNVMPWDLDMMYAPVKHIWSGVIQADRCLDHPEIRTEFRNRCRELIDLLFSDLERHGGHAAQVVEELSQVIDPSGAPLTMVDVDEFMWAYHPQTRGDHRGPWYRLSKTETTLATNYTRTIPTGDHKGFQQNVINYMHDTDTNGWRVNDADENGYGYNYLSFEAQDPDIPAKPSISYSGEAEFPVDGVRFTSTAFRDPQGARTFGAMKWRIGEIRNPSTPSHVPGEPWVYEVESVWESPDLTTFNSEISIPTVVLRPGHTYRARVKHLDDSGRWSHWSNPLEFSPSAPSVAVYQENLVITEIMYNPIGGSDFEFIELKNIGATSLDLTDVRFTKGVDFDFPPGTMIEPGEIMLIVRDRPTFESRYGADLPVLGQWETGDSLSNAGEQLKLSFGAGIAIHDLTFLDTEPWPVSADGSGYSLTLRDPASAPDHALARNWRSSSDLHGSPGRDDNLRGYADWAALHFTAAELEDPLLSGPEADPDEDGLTNFAESYFHGNPRVADPAPGAAHIHDGSLALSFTRRTGASASIDHELEISHDLISWNPDPDASLISIVDKGDGSETVTLLSSEVVSANSRLFLRLQLRSLE